MLSRVAERLYWFGRQIERAENTARLINVNALLILDMPRVARQIWGSMIDITGSNESFYTKYTRAEERNVLRYLLADQSNPASLICTVNLARENARITREILPIESWEKINEFYLYVKRHSDKGVKRDGRYKYLNNVIMFCNQITGLLIGGMSHGNAYQFVRIGKNLERADMGTRIIDVGCMNLLQQKEIDLESYDNLLWMNVLRSLSAYQMYRQFVKDRVNGEDVVDFLIKDPDFPRSTSHCLMEINNSFMQLPMNDLPLRSITHSQRLVSEANINKLMNAGLHEFIDKIQLDLGDIHMQVAHSWFGYQQEIVGSS